MPIRPGRFFSTQHSVFFAHAVVPVVFSCIHSLSTPLSGPFPLRVVVSFSSVSDVENTRVLGMSGDAAVDAPGRSVRMFFVLGFSTQPKPKPKAIILVIGKFYAVVF